MANAIQKPTEKSDFLLDCEANVFAIAACSPTTFYHLKAENNGTKGTSDE